MITGELKSQIDRIWDAFWAGGIANPLEVIEQITYLLFIKRLGEIDDLERSKHRRLGTGKPLFSDAQENLRWNNFKDLEPREMYRVVSEEVFPFIKDLRSDREDSTYSHHMKDARFTIPNAGLLSRVVEMIDRVPMDDRDTKGDVYEYMLSKIATAGHNGQFRTPRHIIKMMVELVKPTPKDIICDPACGTAGFLVAAGEYLRDNHSEIWHDREKAEHFNEKMFHGYDFDNTMLRIGSMNMLLHGVEHPDISYKDSLSEDHAGEEEKYTLILANPPFTGSLDADGVAKDLARMVKTTKTELLFLALFVRLLKPGGRAAVIVPQGVLFSGSNAHKAIRRILVNEQKLDAVIAMPSGVFRPYAGVSTAVLIFTKTNSGGTERVWFYDMKADGLSLDDRRTELNTSDPANDDIPDIVQRWQNLDVEQNRARTDTSFLVEQAEIVDNDYDLSINRYRLLESETTNHVPPSQILDEILRLENEILAGIKEIQGLVN